MFDFASAGRNEGDMVAVNDKGLVTRDRKIKKDAYYLYQANWTSKPMVYIAGRRDTKRTSPATNVKVFSNCRAVTLKVNGKSYGSALGNDMHVFIWKNIPLKEGDNRIEAEAVSTNGAVRDSCSWKYQAKTK
jgi:beta-galactosidase